MLTNSNSTAIPIADADTHTPLFGLLVALGVIELTYELNGSDDSGECNLAEVRYAGGRTDAGLPVLPVGFGGDGRVLHLDTVLESIVADLPEGDWVNNEGGYGTVTIRPTESDPDLRYECDMTFREEGAYGDDDDDEDAFDDIDPPGDPDNTDGPFVIFEALDGEVRP